MKAELTSLGIKNFWLLDGIAALLGISPPGKRFGTAEELKMVTDMNRGVHYSGTGYANMAGVIKDAFTGLAENTLRKIDPLPNVSGKEAHASKMPSHYWRGFSSPVGVYTASKMHKPSKFGHSRAHPYTRK
jgi:hypothetical protein